MSLPNTLKLHELLLLLMVVKVLSSLVLWLVRLLDTLEARRGKDRLRNRFDVLELRRRVGVRPRDVMVGVDECYCCCRWCWMNKINQHAIVTLPVVHKLSDGICVHPSYTL